VVQAPKVGLNGNAPDDGVLPQPRAVDPWPAVDRLIDRAPDWDALCAHRLHLLAARRWREQAREVPEWLVEAEHAASLATVLAGLNVNEQRGDEIRADLHAKTARVLDALDERGIYTPNRDGLPVIEIPLSHAEDIGDVGTFLFDNGIYVTLAAYPLVPRDEVGFRVQLTASNTDEQVDRLIDVVSALADRYPLQTKAREAA